MKKIALAAGVVVVLAGVYMFFEKNIVPSTNQSAETSDFQQAEPFDDTVIITGTYSCVPYLGPDDGPLSPGENVECIPFITNQSNGKIGLNIYETELLPQGGLQTGDRIRVRGVTDYNETLESKLSLRVTHRIEKL